MTKEVNGMLRLNARQPSQSDWASPVVVVPKKNCKPRFRVDYRRLNAVTKKDTYLVQRMDACLDSFGEARFFSMLDCTAGHWQINIREEDREKTAFVCHSGLFEWLRMPFGLTNAPATFQRALDVIQAGLKCQVCLIYLDDVIVFSKTVEEHIQHLDTVLSRLREAGVALNLEKCSLFKTEVEYLGHVVSAGMLRVNNLNTEALRRAAYPTTKTQMKSFLGACNVYRRFVKHYAKRARPLTAFTIKEVPSDLPPPTEDQRTAFEDLKAALMSPPVLRIVHHDRWFVVYVDECADQLGCVLLQADAEDNLAPVGFYSRTLRPAEQSYCTTERECLGLVWVVLTLRHFLEGSRFTVWTDHQALMWIYNTTDPSGRLMRWRLRLAEFDFDVVYKPGASHHAADFMSRADVDGTDDDDVGPADLYDEIPFFALTGTAKSLIRGRYAADPSLTPILFSEIVAAQRSDSLCSRLRRKLLQGLAKAFFTKSDGVLYRRSADGEQLFVPARLRERRMDLEHYPRTAGHPGTNQRYYAMRWRYYWPTIATDIYGLVGRCALCAKSRLALQRRRTRLKLFPVEEPMTDVAIDICGLVVRSEAGNRFVLVMTDRFSKLTRAVALRKITAITVASAFLETWVASYRPPDAVLLDEGAQFLSKCFLAVVWALGVEPRWTTPYHPQKEWEGRAVQPDVHRATPPLCGGETPLGGRAFARPDAGV